MTRYEINTIITRISNVTDQDSLINSSISIALSRVHEYFDWPFYLNEGVINTIASYTTGTVSVTNGSKTITGSGTTFTAAMVGRKIRIESQNAYYRIASYTSATSITLETPYQGDTDSSATFTIFKDEYRLAPDVDKYKIIRQIQNGIPLFSLHPSRFDESFPTPTSTGDPTFDIMSGTKLDSYSTGTVTASGTTLTGSGTSWTSVEGLARGSKFRVGTTTTKVYTVKSVDSDTAITTYETMDSASAVAYEINLNNLVVQLYNIPDTQRNLYYRYFRIPVPLANNYDQPDMPHSWHWVLIYGGLSFIFLHKGDIKKSQIESENRFVNGMEMMKVKLGSFSADRIYKKKSVDSIQRLSDGLERSTFDRRYSMP